MRGCDVMLPACGVMLLLLLAAAGPVAAQRAAPPPIGSLEDALPTASVAQARGALANSTCALLGCTQCVQVPDRALGGTPTTRCARCDRPFKLANGACVCARGWGTFVQPPPERPAPAGWPDEPPPASSCPAVVAGMQPPASCSCRPCPRGYRSKAAPPGDAMCYASGQQQRLAITLALECPPPAGGARAADDGQPSRKLQRALSRVRPAVDRLLTEAAQRSGEATGAVRTTPHEVPFSVSGAGAGAAYWVAVRLSGSRRARDALINAVNDVVSSDACAGWASKTARAGALHDVCAAITAEPQLAGCAVTELHAVATGAAAPPPALVGQPMLYRQQALAPPGSMSIKIDLTSFNSPLQWASKIFGSVAKRTDQSNKLNKKETMWEAKVLAFVDTPILALSIGLTLANLFLPKEDKYLPYLKEINQTTHKILDEVYVLQAQIAQVQTTLQRMEVALSNIRCDIYSQAPKAAVLSLKNFYWYKYAVDVDLGILAQARSTLAEAASKGTFMRLSNAPQAGITQWVNGVLDGAAAAQPVLTLVLNLHDLLVGGESESLIGLCAKAKYEEWLVGVRNARGITLPYDDRQFYAKVTQALDYYIYWQMNGLLMWQEAIMWRAAAMVFEEAARQNVTLSPSQTNPVYFCALATAAAEGEPMAMAKPYCNSHATTTRRVHNNILAQLELLGLPYSTGVEPGQGLRLMMGSDQLGIPGITPGRAEVNITTRWLMPASATAFDPRCKRAGLDEALADECVLLGTHGASCTTGCGGDLKQEAAYASLKQLGSVDYPPGMWQIASNQTMSELAAMFTAFVDAGATGDAADMLALMEAGRATAFVVPFSNMTDRPFWLPGATLELPFQDLYLDQEPAYKRYTQASASWTRAQCFAAYGLANPAGAAGVACSKAGFRGAYLLKLTGGVWADWASPSYFAIQNDRMAARFTPDFYPRATRPCVPPLYRNSDYWNQTWLGIPINATCYTVTTCYGGDPRRATYFRCKPSLMHPVDTNTFLSCGDEAPNHNQVLQDCFPDPVQFPWLAGVKLKDGDALRENPAWSTLRLFRLPVLDIGRLNCSESPFTDAPLSGPRARTAAWGPALTRCGDDKTRAIVGRISAGAYESTKGTNSTATLRLLADDPSLDPSASSPVNVACDVKWIDANGTEYPNDGSYVRVRNVFITVREGPLNDAELNAPRGWMFSTTDIGPASATPAPYLSVRDSLSSAFDTDKRRLVGCVVVGEDPDTGLPVTAAAPSKLAIHWPLWRYRAQLYDFSYPLEPEALADYWRMCGTDADCVGAPAGGVCSCAIRDGCEPSHRMCLPA